MKKVFVTGGAGFIGSHIVDRLVKLEVEIVIYDNLSTGFMSNIGRINTNKITLIQDDCLNSNRLIETMKGCDTVFHLTANADVRGGINNTRIDLEQNTIVTYNVLEAMRINKVSQIVFSSSATVYGEPSAFPTTEGNELIQTSLYGASKLSAEAMIQAYCEYFDMTSYIFRFVSWIGERYSHGVIFDFVKKLKANQGKLEILGDGSQKKSYLYVKDGIDAIFFALDNFSSPKNIFNLGHDSWLNVIDLADIVCEEMGLESVQYSFAGGKRGWKGDSPFVHLDTSKIQSAGCHAQTSIEDGIRHTVQYLLQNNELLEGRT